MKQNKEKECKRKGIWASKEKECKKTKARESKKSNKQKSIKFFSIICSCDFLTRKKTNQRDSRPRLPIEVGPICYTLFLSIITLCFLSWKLLWRIPNNNKTILAFCTKKQPQREAHALTRT